MIWWILGLVAVILILWFAFRGISNNSAGIPNTGVDDSNNPALTATSTPTSTNTTYPLPDAKG